MKNKFGRLSESRKMELYQMNIEDAYNAGYEAGSGFVMGVDFASGKDFTSVVKSPNQRRAELIQRAREFVKEWTNNNGKHETPSFPEGLWLENTATAIKTIDIEWIVNQEKRTVVAIVRNVHKKSIRVRGIAKCHPDEVFNADIGKAIALARALEIEIPQEFLSAVQPDVPLVGMVVKGLEGKIAKLTDDFYGFPGCEPAFNIEGYPKNHYVRSSQIASIIDDTNAAYPEVSTC